MTEAIVQVKFYVFDQCHLIHYQWFLYLAFISESLSLAFFSFFFFVFVLFCFLFCFVLLLMLFFQILTSAHQEHTTAVLMQSASTPMGLTSVSVNQDTLETEEIAQVKFGA